MGCDLMKKNWLNPELKSIDVNSTSATLPSDAECVICNCGGPGPLKGRVHYDPELGPVVACSFPYNGMWEACPYAGREEYLCYVYTTQNQVQLQAQS